MTPLVLALVVAAQTQSEPELLNVRVGLFAEYDSNALRIPKQEGQPPSYLGDGLFRLTLAGDGRFKTRDLLWRYSAAGGGKLFATRETERMIVGQGSLSMRAPLGESTLILTSFAKARTQVSGVRSYLVTRTEARVLSKLLAERFVVRVSTFGASFQSGDAPLFATGTAGLTGGATWFVGEREDLDVQLTGQLRAFPFLQPVPFEDAAPLGDVSRVDNGVSARVALRTQRAVIASLVYVVTRNVSNSRGEDFTRHQFSAEVASRIAGFIASARAAVQLTQYDAGLSIGQQVFLNVNDENQNLFALKLSRPWILGLSAEARLAFYANEIAEGGVSFQRTTAGVGMRGSF